MTHLKAMSILLALSASCCADDASDIDAITEHWRGNTRLFEEGVRAAETFRQSLFADDPHVSPAKLVAAAVQQFPRAIGTSLGDGPHLEGFDIDVENFVRQLAGETHIDGAAFAPFAGRWYGQWDTLQVDHHWLPVESHDPPLLVSESPVAVTAQQFAWVGDGFGWNYVVAPDGDPRQTVILGMVWHVEADDPKSIRLRRPHVGYWAGKDKLVWITAGEIFFEERFSRPGKEPERYAITGFRYRRNGDTLENVGDAFQAIYTRDPDVRPKWRSFPFRFRVASD